MELLNITLSSMMVATSGRPWTTLARPGMNKYNLLDFLISKLGFVSLKGKDSFTYASLLWLLPWKGEKIIVVLFISHYSNKLRCVRFKIDLAVKISRQELTLASCAQPGHLQKLQEGEVLGRVAFVSLHSVDLALHCCYQCWDYMDKCNYPLASICPALRKHSSVCALLK